MIPSRTTQVHSIHLGAQPWDGRTASPAQPMALILHRHHKKRSIKVVEALPEPWQLNHILTLTLDFWEPPCNPNLTS